MTVEISLEGGVPAELVGFDGNELSLLTPRAFAPGAPIRFDIETPGRRLSIQAKSHGSKRTETGSFAVRCRPISLKREDRDVLVALLRP